MRVGSLFSGIGGIDFGFLEAGIETAWMVEIDKNCQSVLRRQFPGVPVYDDVTTVTRKRLEDELGERAAVDVLVGGFPCQDISVAGRRAGLAGERSGLFFEFMRLVDELRPLWVVAENVPGLLSSGCAPKCPGGCIATHGGDMGAVVGTLGELGYGVAWRVLDAQYFGLAQRRKRVFFVGHLGTPWSAPAQVLLESEGVSGDPPSRGTARPEVATGVDDGADSRSRGDRGVVAALTKNGIGVSGPDDNQAQAGHLIPDGQQCFPITVPEVSGTLGGGSGHRGWSDDLDRAGAFIPMGLEIDRETARTLTAHPSGARYDLDTENFAIGDDVATPEVAAPLSTANGVTANYGGRRQEDDQNLVAYGFHHQQDPISIQEGSPPIGTKTEGMGVMAVAENQRAEIRTSDISLQLTTGGGKPGQGYPAVYDPRPIKAMVRRLTPTECERLQGFPVSWTDGEKDSVRYRMLGNAVATPVAGWIARRLREVHERLYGRIDNAFSEQLQRAA